MATTRRRTRSMSMSSDEELETGLESIQTSKRSKPAAVSKRTKKKEEIIEEVEEEEEEEEEEVEEEESEPNNEDEEADDAEKNVRDDDEEEAEEEEEEEEEEDEEDEEDEDEEADADNDKEDNDDKVFMDEDDEEDDEDEEEVVSKEPELGVVNFVDPEEVEMKEALKVEKKSKAIAAKKGKKALKKLAERKAYDSDSENSDNIPHDVEADAEDNSSDESEEDSDEEDGDVKSKKNKSKSKTQTLGGGMAEAFSKILSQKLPETKKNPNVEKAPVLAKRKTKLMKEAEEERLELLKLKKSQETKKKIKEVGLHQPDYKDIEYERSLRRVATRGVVALFNAISQHQHVANEANAESGNVSAAAAASLTTAAKTARDVKQLSKDNFIQMLKAPSSTKTDGETSKASGVMGGSSSAGGASAWLRDDFMTMGGRGKSIKDWERHEEQGGSEGESSSEESEESEEASDDDKKSSKRHKRG